MLKVTAKIPGKIMLAGEYAVLYGGEALAFTVDRFMEVSASPHPERFCLISNLWQEPLIFDGENPPSHLLMDPFVETVLSGAQLCSIRGATVDVRSQLSTQFGIGSSSALRLGVLLALRGLDADKSYFEEVPTQRHWELARLAHDLQRRQQQAASGYDIATQLAGGLVHFCPGRGEDLNPHSVSTRACTAKRLDAFVEFWVGGAGAPTALVVKDTVRFLERHALVQRVMENSALLVNQFLAMCAGDASKAQLAELIRLCVAQREIFEESPHFPRRFFDILKQIPGFDRSFTVKTTGAGGEDALMLIGDTSATKEVRGILQRFDVGFTPSGATLHCFK